MLLKAFIIKSGGKRKIGKDRRFLDFVINNVGCYLENEVYLIGKYLCNSGDTVFSDTCNKIGIKIIFQRCKRNGMGLMSFKKCIRRDESKKYIR